MQRYPLSQPTCRKNCPKRCCPTNRQTADPPDSPPLTFTLLVHSQASSFQQYQYSCSHDKRKLFHSTKVMITSSFLESVPLLPSIVSHSLDTPRHSTDDRRGNAPEQSHYARPFYAIIPAVRVSCAYCCGVGVTLRM